MPATAFDDMPSDDLDAPRLPYAPAPRQLHKEVCPRCTGSGRYYRCTQHGTVCLLCNGRGFKEFKQDAATRQRARATAQARKQASLQRAAEAKAAKAKAWRDANPDVAEWLDAAGRRGFEFAVRLSASLTEWGALTDNQVAAVLRCIEADKARAAEQAKRAESVSVVDSKQLEEAFAKAKASGLKWPKIKLGGVVISPASENSKNAGALYVKEAGQYLGKVLGGRFLRVRECGEEQAQKVAQLIADPAGTAKAYGLQTGECCICSRELTDKESIARGIGPICAERFGF